MPEPFDQIEWIVCPHIRKGVAYITMKGFSVCDICQPVRDVFDNSVPISPPDVPPTNRTNNFE